MRRWLKNRDALRATTPCAGKSPRLTARGSAPDRRRAFSLGPGRVGQDVALAALDLFAGIEAADTAALGHLDALTVDHA